MEIIDRGPLLGVELGGIALLTFRSEQGRKPCCATSTRGVPQQSRFYII